MKIISKKETKIEKLHFSEVRLGEKFKHNTEDHDIYTKVVPDPHQFTDDNMNGIYKKALALRSNGTVCVWADVSYDKEVVLVEPRVLPERLVVEMTQAEWDRIQ
jgi:hypothetical protein